MDDLSDERIACCFPDTLLRKYGVSVVIGCGRAGQPTQIRVLGRAAISADTAFEIGSVTKLFTAFIAMRLMAEGWLDMEGACRSISSAHDKSSQQHRPGSNHASIRVAAFAASRQAFFGRPVRWLIKMRLRGTSTLVEDSGYPEALLQQHRLCRSRLRA